MYWSTNTQITCHSTAKAASSTVTGSTLIVQHLLIGLASPQRYWNRWRTPLDAIGRHVLAGQAIFADDTPVKMLAPSTGKTATARLWAYGRDERPWGSSVPPTSWY
jgi:hypothetical protein